LSAKLSTAGAATGVSPPAAATKPVASEPREPVRKEAKPEAGPLIAARKLPLPKEATNVEFKAIVKQIQFSSARPVETVAKEFSANLKKDGRRVPAV
jgi:hypothetical protein